MVKPFSKPTFSKPTVATPTDPQSGVQLSRQALYDQRMDEIYQDAHAGRCSFEDAVDRVVAAILARTSDQFTPKGKAELEQRVREACASDPQLRKALGR